MSTRVDTAVALGRVVLADRESVFRAWTEPELLRRWCAPEGYRVESAQTDLMVGGGYGIRMENPLGESHTATGEYREIVRPDRLIFTWDWEDDADRVGETLVTVELKPAGDEVTEVALTHELFPTEREAENHRQGWTSCLTRLERLFLT